MNDWPLELQYMILIGITVIPIIGIALFELTLNLIDLINEIRRDRENDR